MLLFGYIIVGLCVFLYEIRDEPEPDYFRAIICGLLWWLYLGVGFLLTTSDWDEE